MRQLIFCSALSLAWFSCGPVDEPPPPPPPEPSCSAKNCAGCCDGNGVCQTGITAQACGLGGASCQACTNGCEAGACKVMAEPLPASAKIVFTSSLPLKGDFGGRLVANQHCANAASAAGLSGTFVAWLSGAERCGSQGCTYFSAKDTVTSDGPWFLLCRDDMGRVRRPFANRAALLTAPTTPLNCDELGRKKDGFVWTGTAVGGNGAPYAQCAGYDSTLGNHSSWTETVDLGVTTLYDLTASTGLSTATDERWTDNGGLRCKESASFYCFQL
jgi:hypothetical protein